MAQLRPPIKFSLGGAASSKTLGGHVSASETGVRSASPRSPSPRAAIAPRSEPTIVEVLPLELAVARLEGEAALASLTDAAKHGGLFACLRREANGSSSSAWSIVFDLAKSSPPENGSELRRMAALCLKRQSSSRAEPPEALAALRQLLADSGLKPWPLAAGAEELILVDHARARVAAHTLIAAGHAVGPPARITPQPDAKGGLKADLVEKFCGVWRLTRRERPPSSVVEKFGRGDGALRIVAPSGVYVEVSILNPGEVVGQASSCGLLSIEDVDGQLMLERHATLSFEPPIGGARSSRVTLDAGAGDDGEDVAVETLIDDSKGSEVDHWERVGSGEVTVLELADVDPTPAGGHTHSGYWLFCAGYWARITGLSHGSGLTASRCCRSLEQAQEVYGEEEVAAEMRSHYRASCGEIDRPGVLSTLREAWSSVSKDGILYDANKNRDEIRKDGDNIVHSPGVGPSTTWDIRAFGMDPFTPMPKRSSKPETPKGLRKSGGSSDSGEDSDKPKNSDSSSDSDKEEKKKAASDSDSDSSDSAKKKEKEKEKEKEKKSRSSSSASSKAKKKEDRSRSRDKKKSRDRSKDKKKDRSRDRRDRSRDRKDSRARDRDRKDRSKSRSRKDKDRDRRDRSRSRRDKDRDRDRDKKDRSRDRDRDRRDRKDSRDKKDRDRSRDRRDRSRDRDKKNRSRSRDKKKKDRSRSRDKDKKDKDKDRSRSRGKDKDKEKEKKSDKKDKKAKASSDSDSDDKKKKKKKKGSSSNASSDADAKKNAEKKPEKKDGSDSSSDSNAEKKKKEATKKSDSSDSDGDKAKKEVKKEADKKSDSSDSDDDKKAKKKKEASDSDNEGKKNGGVPAKKAEAVKDSDSDSS